MGLFSRSSVRLGASRPTPQISILPDVAIVRTETGRPHRQVLLRGVPAPTDASRLPISWRSTSHLGLMQISSFQLPPRENDNVSLFAHLAISYVSVHLPKMKTPRNSRRSVPSGEIKRARQFSPRNLSAGNWATVACPCLYPAHCTAGRLRRDPGTSAHRRCPADWDH